MRKCRVATIIEDLDRPGCHTILKEVETQPCSRHRLDISTVDTVSAKLAEYTIAPGIGRHRRDPGSFQSEASTRGGNVRFGATDLYIENPGRFKARWRRNSQAEQYLSERHKIVHQRVRIRQHQVGWLLTTPGSWDS